MADTALILGVTGVLTSGVVGPWVANRFAADRQRRELAHERSMTDRQELRGLLDEAANALHQASDARKAAESAVTSYGAAVGVKVPGLKDTMANAGKPLAAVRERILVRLGSRHPVSEAFRGVDEAFVALFAPVMYLCDHGMDEGSISSDTWNEVKQAAAAYEKHRSSFMDAVAAAVGVRLDEDVPRRSILSIRQD